MQGNRDTVLSDFVRMKIREWESSGREQKELAALAGFAKSTVAQVKKGTGVGAKTAPGFARALGFPDVETMVDAAYEWRRGTGEDLERLAAEPNVRAATAIVLGMQAGATEAQIRAILAAYVHPRFRGRDAEWWVPELLTEVQIDLARDRAAEMAQRNETAHRASKASEIRGAWRAASTEKTKLAVALESASKKRPKKRRATA